MAWLVETSWLEAALDRLSLRPAWGYHPDDEPQPEPTAAAAQALARHGRFEAARRALDWLAEVQQPDGRVATAAEPESPGWPTGLAIAAWRTAADDRRAVYDSNCRRGAEWLLTSRGKPLANRAEMGHDASLVAWSWVENTHSWIEPTAMAVMALKAERHAAHPRVREAVRLIWNRQLPIGGFNYGNTFVLGQMLRPHLLPTALALLALADEPGARKRLARSRDYLARGLSADSPGVSLGYGLLALEAYCAAPEARAEWLAAAYRRTVEGNRSPWTLALLAWASPVAERGDAT